MFIREWDRFVLVAWKPLWRVNISRPPYLEKDKELQLWHSQVPLFKASLLYVHCFADDVNITSMADPKASYQSQAEHEYPKPHPPQNAKTSKTTICCMRRDVTCNKHVPCPKWRNIGNRMWLCGPRHLSTKCVAEDPYFCPEHLRNWGKGAHLVHKLLEYIYALLCWGSQDPRLIRWLKG